MERAKRGQHDNRLYTAKLMPPLRKMKRLGENYCQEEDEVLAWVSKQTELLQYLVNKLSQIGFIKYESGSGVWQGVDYEA